MNLHLEMVDAIVLLLVKLSCSCMSSQSRDGYSYLHQNPPLVLTYAFIGRNAAVLDSQAAARTIWVNILAAARWREACIFSERCACVKKACGASLRLWCTCLYLHSSFSCYHTDVTPVWRACDKSETCYTASNVSVAYRLPR